MKIKTYLKKCAEMPRQLKASFCFLICVIVQKSINIVTTPVFTRKMTVEEYGQFNVFSSWQSIVTCIVTLELSAGIYVQGLVKFDENKKKFSAALQGMTFTLIVVWGVIFFAFSSFWNQLFSLSSMQIIFMLGIIWTNAVFAFWASEQRVCLNYIPLFIITCIASITQIVLCIILVTISADKVTARIAGILFSNCLCYMCLFLKQIYEGKTFFSKEIWCYALKLGIPLVPHYLSSLLLNSADRIMINDILGSQSAGIYSLAYTIARFGILFNTAVLQTINPWIYEKIKEKNFNIIKEIAHPALILIALVNLVFIFWAPEIVKLCAPLEYYDSIWVIPPIAMSVYFMFAYNLFSNIEFFYEKTGYISIATVVGAVINIILNHIFIRIFGYIAAGYTTLVCYILFVIMHYIFSRKICREKLEGINIYDIKKMIKISGCFILAGFIVMLTYNDCFMRYILFLIFFGFFVLKRKEIFKYLKEHVNGFRGADRIE